MRINSIYINVKVELIWKKKLNWTRFTDKTGYAVLSDSNNHLEEMKGLIEPHKAEMPDQNCYKESFRGSPTETVGSLLF